MNIIISFGIVYIWTDYVHIILAAVLKIKETIESIVNYIAGCLLPIKTVTRVLHYLKDSYQPVIN